MPTVMLGHKNLLHFAGFKKHIGFFPGSATVREFESELAGFKHAKGSVQFPIEGPPLPIGLIIKMVDFRVKLAVNEAAAGAKKK